MLVQAWARRGVVFMLRTGLEGRLNPGSGLRVQGLGLRIQGLGPFVLAFFCCLLEDAGRCQHRRMDELKRGQEIPNLRTRVTRV